MNRGSHRGFTLVEVLVALMVVALALAALMSSVSSAARASEYLRDKTIAQWISMNRIEEVRLNMQKFGDSGDKGELDFANRHWRYDTRYFDTDIPTIRRFVVRVWPKDAKDKAGPLAESSSFLGASLSPLGTSNSVDWTQVPTGGGGAPTDPTNPANPANPTNPAAPIAPTAPSASTPAPTK